jgi:hypothetical protein
MVGPCPFPESASKVFGFLRGGKPRDGNPRLVVAGAGFKG